MGTGQWFEYNDLWCNICLNNTVQQRQTIQHAVSLQMQRLQIVLGMFSVQTNIIVTGKTKEEVLTLASTQKDLKGHIQVKLVCCSILRELNYTKGIIKNVHI